MGKEPYNLFADAGSTLPGGSAYDDLLVILKAIVVQSGGRIVVDEINLMYVDKDEVLRVHEDFSDGTRRKVFTVDQKHLNQNPEGHIPHSDDAGNNKNEQTLGYKLGRFAGIVVVYSFVALLLLAVSWLFKAVF
jgi:hypothetical protein